MTDAGRRGLTALGSWLHRHHVGWICVISPHLDDAAFSIATVLTHDALPPREVWTVFSATTADGDLAYAKAMGFDDPLQEFEARREEDRDAMRRLGVPYRHVGAVASRFDAAARGSLVHDVRAATRARAAASLVLLPAGAGAVIGTARRLWGRVTRMPLGCAPHGEHEWVRDALRAGLVADHGSALRAGPDTCLVGYYAEVPYLWAEGPQRLAGRLRALDERRLEGFAIAPDVDTRLEVARAYRSQFAAEFGHKASFQRRSLSGAEWLFLPT